LLDPGAASAFAEVPRGGGSQAGTATPARFAHHDLTMFDLLYAHPVLLSALAGVFGLVVGSFLNVTIYRLPIMLEREWRAHCAELAGHPAAPVDRFDLAFPGSRCPSCGHPLAPWENIPILSYLMLRGRCSACHVPISPRYPLVEALTGLLSAVAVWRLGPQWPALWALLLTWALIALAFIDLGHQLLPDAITQPVLWLGLGLSVFAVFTDSRDAIFGAIAGYLSLWAVYQVFKTLTGKEGMGYGDFKLLALLGAWLGWQALPLVILLSSLSGAVLGVALISVGAQDRTTPFPFGPHLALAGWIALLWGRDLSHWYLGLWSPN
jgi:leader peptidase (prepilin peptidase)/N-methyltransferase